MAPLKQASFSPQRTISRDLTFSLALMTALVVSIFGVAFQLYDTKREVAELKIEADAMADEFADVLARPLWNIDVDTVNQIARAYLSSGFLTAVRVKAGVETYFDNLPDAARSDHWITLKRDIVNDGETIGTVALMFSKAQVETIRRRSILWTLLTVFVVTAVIGLGSHQLLKHLVVKPINRLIDGVRTIAAGNYQLVLPAEKRSDINALISEINIMASEIDRRESDLIKLRETLKNIVDSMPSVLVGVDPEGRVTQWNQEVQKLTGIDAEQALGRHIESVYPSIAETMQKVNRAIRDKRPLKESKVTSHVDGEVRYSDITIYPLKTGSSGGAVIRVDDITERVRIEEMMVQSEKMLSVGGLAAGMAHEINNPLAGILQNIQVMRNRLSSDLRKNHDVAKQCGISMEAVQAYMQARNMPEMLSSIMDSGKRAAKIVENMLSFSRKSEAKTTQSDLADLLDATLDLAGNDYDLKKRYDFRKIKIIREYDSGVSEVACEATEIQQVLLNILKNGAQAMAEDADTTDPQFTLRVKSVNGMVQVEIEDNGPGMDETVRKRLFEPFYTTKAVGVGTGLGLSVSYFIITENHGGSLSVTSTPGAGSCFVIRLPITR